MALSLSAEPYGALENDDWRDQSACRDTDPDLFFPVGTTGPAIEQIAQAKAVCRRVRGPGRRASSSPSSPTRTPASGAAPPRRSAASSAGRGSPASAAPADPRSLIGGGRRPRPTTTADSWFRGRSRRAGSIGTTIRTTVPVPCSTGCMLDRPRQLGADQRPHDRQAEAAGGLEPRTPRAGPRRRPGPPRPGRAPPVAATARSSPPPAAGREGVVGGVLEQLVEHDGERRGHRGRDSCRRRPRPGSAPGAPGRRRPPRPCGERSARCRGTGRPRRPLAGQRLVHQGDRADAPHRLLDRRLRLRRGHSGGPGGAAATRSSAGCSSPGGGSPGWWRPSTAAAGPGAAARRCRAGAPRRRSTAPSASSGMQRSTTVTSGPRSSSWVTGRALAKADRTASRRGRARPGACPRRWRARRCGAAPTRRSATRTPPASGRRARAPRRRRGAAASVSASSSREREVAARRSCGRSG